MTSFKLDVLGWKGRFLKRVSDNINRNPETTTRNTDDNNLLTCNSVLRHESELLLNGMFRHGTRLSVQILNRFHVGAAPTDLAGNAE